jgi:hypothetical protein
MNQKWKSNTQIHLLALTKLTSRQQPRPLSPQTDADSNANDPPMILTSAALFRSVGQAMAALHGYQFFHR